MSRQMRMAVDVGQPPRDPKSWAHALKVRDQAGGNLTDAQRAMYRAVTERRFAEASEDGDFPTPESLDQR